MIHWPPDWGRNNLHSLSFISSHEDLVCYGDVGTGKTHLAIATGYAACHAGYSVRFFTAASLIAFLREVTEKGVLDQAITRIGKTDLLIIDEFVISLSITKEHAWPTKSSLTLTKPSPLFTPRTSNSPGGPK